MVNKTTWTDNARHGLRWLGIMLLLVMMGGCSGGYSFTGASIPPEAKTVSVKQFANVASTVNPQLSQKLSDELRNMFTSQTTLNAVNSDGDLQISGEITNYGTRTAAVSSSDEAASNRFTITIKVKFTNEYDPKADFEQTFSRYKDYNASQDFSSVESSLMSQIVTELVEDVFNKAVVNW